MLSIDKATTTKPNGLWQTAATIFFLHKNHAANAESYIPVFLPS
jgi:hypothetical protein